MREYYEAVLEDLKRVKLQTEQAIEALEKLADLHGPRVQAAPSKLMAAAYPAAYQEAYAGTGFPPASQRSPRRFSATSPAAPASEYSAPDCLKTN